MPDADESIYEQLQAVCAARKGQIMTTSEIRDLMAREFGANRTSVIPSDHCYNRVNKGARPPEQALFEQVKRGHYRYLGTNARYSGQVLHRPRGGEEQVVGEWTEGRLRWISTD